MALVQRDGRAGQLAAMAGTVSAAQVLKLVSELSRMLPGGYGSRSNVAGKRKPAARPNKKGGKSGKKQEANIGVRPNASASMMFRSIGNGGGKQDRLVVSDFGLYGLGTGGTTGSGNTFIRVALSNIGTSDSLLTNLCPKFASIHGLYGHWELKRLKVMWVPALADNASGNIAIMFDQREKAAGTLDADITSYVRKDYHCFGHITAPNAFTWTPRDAGDKAQRLVQSDSNNLAQVGYGFIKFAYTTNQLTAGVSLGYVRVEATIEFHDPQ